MTTSSRVQVGTDQHTLPRGDLIPKDSGIMTENEATGANGRGSPPPTRPRIGEATEKALNHPKRDTEKSTFRSRMRSKTVSTQRVTPSRRISPEAKEKQTKPSFRSRTAPASTQRVTPSRRISPEAKEKQTKPSFRSRTAPASTLQG